MTRSWFLTGWPDAVFQPFFFQPWIHLVMESSSSVESVTMHAVEPGASERRPSSAAVYSMRLLVVWPSPPDSSTVPAPSAPTTIAAHPPGPGLPLQAPSVQTSASPGRASTGTSGARGALERRRRYGGAVEAMRRVMVGGAQDGFGALSRSGRDRRLEQPPGDPRGRARHRGGVEGDRPAPPREARGSHQRAEPEDEPAHAQCPLRLPLPRVLIGG